MESNVIKANRARPGSLGVRELALFGSNARGDAGPDNDVDFVVDFDEKSFDRYMTVKGSRPCSGEAYISS